MKPIWISFTIILMALSNLSFSTPLANAYNEKINEGEMYNFSAFKVAERVNDLEGEVDFTYNEVVERYIKHYVIRGKKVSEIIIGRSELFFPIFEHYLQANQLPEEIKYLAIVESALDPNALSPVGAAGLWQFMTGTGQEYGLKIDSYVDERKDPIRATQAAFRYLQKLHKRYNDWTLALAAYNCGPGRVNRAIRESRSRDFWKIRPYLPQETRNYVPFFIAATYMMKFYDAHGLQPRKPSFDFETTATTRIFKGISFYQLSKICGTPVSIIKDLNPSYKRLYIPQSSFGNYITLPKEGMSKYQEHLTQINIANNFQKDYPIPVDSVRSTYVVQKGENLEYVAWLIKCDQEKLTKWNKLPKNPALFYGQELEFYFPKESLMTEEPEEKPVEKVQPRKPRRMLYHVVQKGETIQDIMRFYPDVPVATILEQNNLPVDADLVLGTKLRIKEL